MWNLDPNRPELPWKYAGAVDVPLSEKGITEAIRAGKALRELPIDVVYCSMLIRAQTTTLIALASHQEKKAPLLVRDSETEPDKRGLRAHKAKMSKGSHQTVLPVYCSYQLNERSFGELQGMYEWEQKRKFSKRDLREFRREWDVPFPGGESQAQVFDRTVRFFERHIRGQLNQGKNVLICCHGFVVRAILAYILELSPQDFRHQMDLDLAHDPASLLHSKNAIPRVFSYEPTKPDSRELKGAFKDISDQYPFKESKPAKSKL